MNQQNKQPEKLKDKLRFSQEQYDFLIDRTKKGQEGISEWNQWRNKKENLFKDIDLDGVDLSRRYLKGIHLGLRGFEGNKSNVYLRGANLSWSNLQNTALMNAHLEGAKLYFSHLEDADIAHAHLEEAECQRANVNSNTSFWECKVSRETHFLGVNLNVVKIDPATKQLLEYNIRRKNWEDWYKEHAFLKFLVRTFWWISDYGISTKRIIFTFFGLALLFAAVYSLFAFLSPPGVVSNLEVEPHLPLWHYGLLVFLRPVYFSVVTMTTLGFGDIYANARSIWGHILLTFQVILGYVLLGALVTRFAVLFTAGGPAGKFADEKKIKNKNAKIKTTN